MLYEVTPTKAHLLDFVPGTSLDSYTGFRSICAYGAADVKAAQKAGTITALREVPHFCEHIFLDFDDNAEAAKEAVTWFFTNGYTHTSYDSGGRSIHIEAPITPLYHKNAAYSIRKFSEQFVRVDTSYQHYAGLFRLPGTLHEKTGRPKVMLTHMDGGTLSIPLIDRPVSGLTFKKDKLAGDALIPYIGYYQTLIGSCPSEGGRYKALLTQAFNFQELGFSIDTTEDLLAALNGTWNNPKTPLEIRKICQDAYNAKR